jgi:hypothetical protein
VAHSARWDSSMQKHGNGPDATGRWRAASGCQPEPLDRLGESRRLILQALRGCG